MSSRTGRHGHGCGGPTDCCCDIEGPRIHGFLVPSILLQLRSEPAHGYRLMETLSERPYMSHLPDQGVLYRHLRRLEEHGLVSSTYEPGAGPARRVYAITDEGRSCLADWVEGFRRLETQLASFIADFERKQ